MKNPEQVTPVAAAVTALSTLLCCVPTSFAAAIATTSAGLFVAHHQGWFLAASVGLIAIGVIQLRRATVCSTGRKRWSAIVLAVSVGNCRGGHLLSPGAGGPHGRLGDAGPVAL
jgi:hypothetical protein